MEKEFVPYELALRLKELGFYCDCFGDYFKFGNQEPFLVTSEDRYRIEEDNEGEDILRVSAPTFSQAFRWFRENYKMNPMIQITTSNGTRENWFWEIYDSRGWKVKDGQELSDPYNISYEEAEIACLDKLMEIVEGIGK